MSRIIQQIIEYHIGIKDIDVRGEMILEEIGIDSLDCCEICMDIEDKFGIMIEDEELNSIKKIQDIFDIVNKKEAEKQENYQRQRDENKK